MRPLIPAFLLVLAASAGADEFDLLEGPLLAGVPGAPIAEAHEALTIEAIGRLPNVLDAPRAAPLVVTTDEGNLARLIVTPARRKPPGGPGAPAPVLVLERFATFAAPGATTRLARGGELILFDGFRVDLELGGVVPDGQGGDLQFRADVEGGGPRLVALGRAGIYTLSASPLPPAAARPGPTPGRVVRPGDFAGRYRLFADGTLSGTLDLEVDGQGTVSGHFRSDRDGALRRVAGAVAADIPQRVRFAIEFPRTRQEFEGCLWTEGKGAMAGTTTLLGRPYGFFALREGGQVAPNVMADDMVNAASPPDDPS